ncbi:hypothetical protein F2Q68_00043509 [Brassica cretica]|uniref:Uncharacterized protein n=1 Tax=Brassica cretica TaxID=69181 RepID=A0A8S9LNY7_BRACR|nr:hypothetical protein F2Q68_00043509 [Brassica cretica]
MIRRGSRQRTPPRSFTLDRGPFLRDTHPDPLEDKERAHSSYKGGGGERENRHTSADSRIGRPPQRPPASHRLSHGQASVHSRLGERVWVDKASQSQISYTPPPRPPREPMNVSQEVNSSLERRPALERIALPVARNLLTDGDDLNFQKELPSQERVPALQRITPPSSARVPLLLNGAANSDSGRLQEVEVQYLEDTFPTHILNNSGGPSSSRLPAKEQLTLPQISPIRSPSSDRRHLAAYNLATSLGDESDHDSHNSQIAPLPTKAKATSTSKAKGKRTASDKPPPKRRIARSPLQG